MAMELDQTVEIDVTGMRLVWSFQLVLELAMEMSGLGGVTRWNKPIRASTYPKPTFCTKSSVY